MGFNEANKHMSKMRVAYISLLIAILMFGVAASQSDAQESPISNAGHSENAIRTVIAVENRELSSYIFSISKIFELLKDLEFSEVAETSNLFVFYSANDLIKERKVDTSILSLKDESDINFINSIKTSNNSCSITRILNSNSITILSFDNSSKPRDESIKCFLLSILAIYKTSEPESFLDDRSTMGEILMSALNEISKSENKID